MGEALGEHRRRALEETPQLTLTKLYNLIAQTRGDPASVTDVGAGTPRVHTLNRIHQQIDAIVIAAYGWPSAITEAAVVERFTVLNGERLGEEAAGLTRFVGAGWSDQAGAAAAGLANHAGRQPRLRLARVESPPSVVQLDEFRSRRALPAGTISP